MKVKREMPLSEALDEIASAVDRLKEEGAARVNGYEVKLDDRVMLEIEQEVDKKSAELEFEIKWPLKKSRSRDKGRVRGRGRRRLLIGAATGVALGAAALFLARQRRTGAKEEDEFSATE